MELNGVNAFWQVPLGEYTSITFGTPPIVKATISLKNNVK
jgi:hypothetical protein